MGLQGTSEVVHSSPTGDVNERLQESVCMGSDAASSRDSCMREC